MKFWVVTGSLLLQLLFYNVVFAVQSSKKLVVLPLRTIEAFGNIKYFIDLPCQSQFLGILLRQQKNDTALAALAEQDDVRCSSIPKPYEISLAMLPASVHAGFRPLSIPLIDKLLLLTKVIEVRSIRQNSSTLSDLDLIYETRCGQAVATVMRELNQTSLELGVIELIDRRKMQLNCSYEQKLATVKSVKLKSNQKYFPISEFNPEVYKNYDLRLAEVHQKSIEFIHKKQMPTLIYKRACHEAPVGLVIDAQHRQGKVRYKLGVLVTRFYNWQCEKTEKKFYWDLMFNRFIKIRSSDDISFYKSSHKIQAFRLKPPYKFSRSTGMELSYFQGCANPLGVVYTSNKAQQDVAIALLERQNEFSCKDKLKLVTIKQHFFNVFSPARFYPLRLSY